LGTSTWLRNFNLAWELQLGLGTSTWLRNFNLAWELQLGLGTSTWHSKKVPAKKLNFLKK